jgi:hypothetical protein
MFTTLHEKVERLEKENDDLKSRLSAIESRLSQQKWFNPIDSFDDRGFSYKLNDIINEKINNIFDDKTFTDGLNDHIYLIGGELVIAPLVDRILPDIKKEFPNSSLADRIELSIQKNEDILNNKFTEAMHTIKAKTSSGLALVCRNVNETPFFLHRKSTIDSIQNCMRRFIVMHNKCVFDIESLIEFPNVRNFDLQFFVADSRSSDPNEVRMCFHYRDKPFRSLRMQWEGIDKPYRLISQNGKQEAERFIEAFNDIGIKLSYCNNPIV